MNNILSNIKFDKESNKNIKDPYQKIYNKNKKLTNKLKIIKEKDVFKSEFRSTVDLTDTITSTKLILESKEEFNTNISILEEDCNNKMSILEEDYDNILDMDIIENTIEDDISKDYITKISILNVSPKYDSDDSIDDAAVMEEVNNYDKKLKIAGLYKKGSYINYPFYKN